MPILGLQLENTVVNENRKKINKSLIAGFLPDGICTNIKKEDDICSSYNNCLFCSMFRTFKDDLPTHKAHLQRIRGNKSKYLDEKCINCLDRVNEIEKVLVELIERLEKIDDC